LRTHTNASARAGSSIERARSKHTPFTSLGFGVAALFAIAVSGCGASDQPSSNTAPRSTASAGTATTRTADTTRVPGTTTPVGTAAPTSSTPAPTTSASTPIVTSSTTTPVPTQPRPTSAVTIKPGTTPEEKAWCLQAKPVSAGLNNLLGLSLAQFEDLVNQAMALKPSAPQSIQTQLALLADVGARFLAAIKAGQATLSVEGIAKWSNETLTPAQQQAFLLAAGDVTLYINSTC
jgi:hypothetical protein